jgi:hypothetical protein
MTALAAYPIPGALGAEISGVDLSRDLDRDVVAAIRRAWLDMVNGVEVAPATI